MSLSASEGGSTRREWGLTVLAGLAVVVFSLLLLLRDPGFFYHDDYQIAAMPALFDTIQAFKVGEWPLLSPYSWVEGNLAGELQSGVFSAWVLLALLAVWSLNLSLPLTAAAYSILHLAILAMGSFRLARHCGLPPELAAVVVMATTLNGFIIGWSATNWITLLTSFCWLPWAWWAMSRAIAPGASLWRMLPAALFLYLVLAAGWPFTIIMAVMATAWLSLKILVQSRAIGPVVVLFFCWVIGGGLAAPAYLMFLENLPETIRGAASEVTAAWTVPPAGLWGLVLPSVTSYWGEFNPEAGGRLHVPLELFNGLVPVAAVLVALAAARRRFMGLAGWEFVFALLALGMILMPSVANMRWSFRWLPLTHLLLALTAAWALFALRDRVESEIPRLQRLVANPGLWAAVAVAIAWALDPRRVAGPGLTLQLMAIAVGWMLLELVLAKDAPLRRWAPATALTLSLWCCFLHVPVGLSVPTWNIPEAIRQPAPLEKGTRYMGVWLFHQLREADEKDTPFGQLIRPGNSSMYAGVEFVNGYSPVGPRGLLYMLQQDPHGFLLYPAAMRMLRRETADAGLLRLWGVDGLVVGYHLTPEIRTIVKNGWSVTGTTPEGTLLKRNGPPSPRLWSVPGVVIAPDFLTAVRVIEGRKQIPAPFVVVEPNATERSRPYAPVEAQLVTSQRNRQVVTVKNTSASQPALLGISKPWFPGYRAWLNGQELPIKVLNVTIPAVELPPGAEGTLELVYRPKSLERGLAISATMLVGAPLVIGFLARRRRRAP